MPRGLAPTWQDPAAPEDRAAGIGRGHMAGMGQTEDGTAIPPEVWTPVLSAIARQVAEQPASAGTRGDDPARRQPAAGLRRRVQVRHRTCVAAGCRKPAVECEIDHRQDYARGGETLESNLQPLCKFHHRMKHTAGWRLVALDERTYRWTTPNGNHIDVRPPPILDDLPEPTPRDQPTTHHASDDADATRYEPGAA